ncbi:MAG TPA: HAD family hydrolase [Candidatus Solibacter sp.]|nr:HAD family hydrolase [Candidatus Solibacter sp.]
MIQTKIPAFPVYLFDIDGTLLDSAKDICGAVQQVLDKNPCPPVTFEYLQSFIGRHLDDLFGDIFPGATPERLAELLGQYRAVYPARGHKMTSVYPGVAEALASLGGRKGTATTKGTPTTRAILEQFSLLPHFHHVQGTDGFPCKPAPDVIFKCLEALGARPADCLFVGDSAADMEAGRRAGVQICAVTYGYGQREALAKYEPDYWIDNLQQLVA